MENATRLTSAYFRKQIDRTVATLNRITGRSRLSAGRVIPGNDDLPIHDGRRLDATVMFLDISKFSARPSSTEQEQDSLLRVLSLFFSEMIRIVEDYGGSVEKNTGDGLMAYFAAETGDVASPQQKALTAALTMFHAAETLINPVLSNARIQPLDFRICLDHGPITVANVGAPGRFRGIVAIGATANIASKMLGFADPNTILIGSTVLAGLPTVWQSEFVQLKTLETGWVYTQNSLPYAFWQYNGRWRTPDVS